MRIGTHFLSTTKGVIGVSVWRPPAMRTTTATSAHRAVKSGFVTRTQRPNAPRLSCAARAGGRAHMTCGARQYVGAQLEFCQGRAAQLEPLLKRHTASVP